MPLHSYKSFANASRAGELHHSYYWIHKKLGLFSDKHSAVLIPVRLEDISYDIAFDCKINMSSWSTSPKQFSLHALCQLGRVTSNSDITSDYNINRQSWPSSPYQLSSFEPVTLPVRLGNINSDITSNYNINRPSWPAFPYQLSSIEPVTLPVRLGIINSNIASNYNINKEWPWNRELTLKCKL